MDVTVLNRQRRHRLSAPALARVIARVASRRPAADADSVTVMLVSDERMRRLNRDFRGIDRPTDVLSFGAEDDDPPLPGDRHLGDIAIAVPTAARQARAAGHGLAREIKLLALHGYLHLLGYDHETDGGRMRRLEMRLRRELLPGARGAA